ncbi:LytR/AlgR family response regulator transcription factor [Ideonella sp.]|uniref:LytR/AlgR family response regulator transcription factor n=1 Tax=Ideonella sp. TaxID=1929293 RepID=UPI0035AF11AD
MTTPTALIADDEPHLVRHLQQQLAQLWPELHIVATARNGLEAAQAIATHAPDLAFLDIRMPGLTGLEVAQGVEGRTRVVFVTAYDEFAVQAFDQAALDYLLKPVTAERLGRCVQRLRAAVQAAPDEPDARLAQTLRRLLPAAAAAQPAPARLRWIRASAGEVTHQVGVDEVVCFQADDKYTCVHTASGREHLIRTPITELAAQLDPDQFWQVHRATLVNLAFLDSTRRDEASRLWLRLRGLAQELPVSRAYVHLFKAM